MSQVEATNDFDKAPVSQQGEKSNEVSEWRGADVRLESGNECEGHVLQSFTVLIALSTNSDAEGHLKG